MTDHVVQRGQMTAEQPIDRLTMDPRIAGSGSWKAKMYEFHKNFTPQNMVEIGERGLAPRPPFRYPGCYHTI